MTTIERGDLGARLRERLQIRYSVPTDAVKDGGLFHMVEPDLIREVLAALTRAPVGADVAQIAADLKQSFDVLPADGGRTVEARSIIRSAIVGLSALKAESAPAPPHGFVVADDKLRAKVLRRIKDYGASRAAGIVNMGGESEGEDVVRDIFSMLSAAPPAPLPTGWRTDMENALSRLDAFCKGNAARAYSDIGGNARRTAFMEVREQIAAEQERLSSEVGA